MFSREMYIHLVRYGTRIQFWPTLHMTLCVHLHPRNVCSMVTGNVRSMITGNVCSMITRNVCSMITENVCNMITGNVRSIITGHRCSIGHRCNTHASTKVDKTHTHTNTCTCLLPPPSPLTIPNTHARTHTHLLVAPLQLRLNSVHLLLQCLRLCLHGCCLPLRSLQLLVGHLLREVKYMTVTMWFSSGSTLVRLLLISRRSQAAAG